MNGTYKETGDQNGDFDVTVVNPSEKTEKLDVSSSRPSSSESKKEKQKKVPEPNVGYFSLYRFADCWDILLVILGTIAAVIHGAALPVMFVFFGDLTEDFTKFGVYQQCDFNYTKCVDAGLFNGSEAQWNETAAGSENLTDNTIRFVYMFVYLACGVLVCATLQVATYSLQALRQSKRIRVAYFKSILRQDMSFHDTNPSGELNAHLADDVKKIHDGMADKVAIALQYLSMTITGLIIAFIYSWRLALVTLAGAPLLGISSSLLFVASTRFTKLELDAYAKAGGIAQESISAIRTVVAFGCQDKEVERYSHKLGSARSAGIKKGAASGISIGFLYLTMFGLYAISFWYGTILVIDEVITVGDMMTTFFAVLIAAFALGSVGGNAEYFSAAKSAGYKIFSVIERQSEIDVFSKKGLKPDDTKGAVEFENVRFHYPTRTDVEILKDVSFTVDVGKTVALVGQSGCGKSTCIQLIQRFYDCIEGSVKIDGINVKDYNVNFLRNNIGVVAQEPVLFGTTIAENIRWGKDGVTDQEIERAAKEANAYDFIMKLPKKFETLVGEGGGQLSGGQKQRIAIARAIVRNPKIMLLDEATSALDTESESIVQSALEKASKGRTTIVIAHRLSTIINANKIVTFSEGKIMEQGTHEELLKIPDGVYANLVTMQMVSHDGDMTGDAGALAEAGRKRILSDKSHHKQEIDGFKKEGEEEEEDEEEEKFPPVPMTRILSENKPEWAYIFFGCIFAAVAGCVDPLNAVIFSRILVIFTYTDEEQQRSEAVFYALMFLVLGGVAMIAYTTESLLMAKAGMELTTRLRIKTFKAMLRQNISFFDDHKHSTGILCTRLATDASRVQGASGVRIGTIIKNISTMAVALGISFAFGWQLTLVTLAFVPFIALGGYLEMSLLMGQAEKEKHAYEGAGRVSSEATHQIRTVASLTREETLFQMYREELKAPVKNGHKKAIYSGVGYGYSQCVIYFAYAVVFRYGIYLVEVGAMSFDDVFLVLTAVIFGAMALGQNSSFAPDYAEAQVSSYRIFHLLDIVPDIDAYATDGLQPGTCDGEIVFKDAEFVYPTRPDVLVLKSCNYEVKSGQMIALVGQSGCGKSTCVQLIERFYDPCKGIVSVDGCDVKELNISWLRQQIGIVSQEPVLFNQSIKENILYGDIKNQHTLEDVIECAKKSNIHDFITSLPEGYDTSVGQKGGQLSGGQKQRIAIARALLRNPKILLLDEATSALDAESEKIVQEALDSARVGRTSIVIAHRLTTVKDADLICVLDNGEIVERGTHDELITKRGAYFSLVNAQLQQQRG